MHTKFLLFTIFALFIGLQAFSQDRIIKKNGETIEAKVSVINQESIVFKRFDNLEGPEYSIPKADVAKIKYANGTEDIFEDNNDKIGVKRKDTDNPKDNKMHNEAGLKRNIISLAPIGFTENGVGVGVSIEHILDSKGIVNFYMPVYATFKRNTNDDGAYNSSGAYIGTGNVTTYPMVYFMPGIKIYTNLNSSRKVKFSVGPNLVAAFGSGTITNENYYTTGVPTNSTVNRTLLGAMANIGLSIFPTPHLYMGIEYGLGFCYMNDYGGVNQGFSALTAGSLKIGYRFK